MEGKPSESPSDDVEYGYFKTRRLFAAALVFGAAAWGVGNYDDRTSRVDEAKVEMLTGERDRVAGTLSPDQKVIAQLTVTAEQLVAAGASPELFAKLEELDDAEEALARAERGDSNPLLGGAALSLGAVALGLLAGAGKSMLNVAVELQRRHEEGGEE